MSKHDGLKEIDSKDLETTTGGAGSVGDSIGGGLPFPGRPGPTFPKPPQLPGGPRDPNNPRGVCMACGMG